MPEEIPASYPDELMAAFCQGLALGQIETMIRLETCGEFGPEHFTEDGMPLLDSLEALRDQLFCAIGAELVGDQIIIQTPFGKAAIKNELPLKIIIRPSGGSR